MYNSMVQVNGHNVTRTIQAFMRYQFIATNTRSTNTRPHIHEVT